MNITRSNQSKIYLNDKAMYKYLDKHGLIYSKRNYNEYNLIKKFEDKILGTDLSIIGNRKTFLEKIKAFIKNNPPLSYLFKQKTKTQKTPLERLLDADKNLRDFASQNYVSAEGLTKGSRKVIELINEVLLKNNNNLKKYEINDLKLYKKKLIDVVPTIVEPEQTIKAKQVKVFKEFKE